PVASARGAGRRPARGESAAPAPGSRWRRPAGALRECAGRWGPGGAYRSSLRGFSQLDCVKDGTTAINRNPVAAWWNPVPVGSISLRRRGGGYERGGREGDRQSHGHGRV